MTTKEFVNKYKKVYTSLINDPDTKETENKTRGLDQWNEERKS